METASFGEATIRVTLETQFAGNVAERVKVHVVAKRERDGSFIAKRIDGPKEVEPPVRNDKGSGRASASEERDARKSRPQASSLAAVSSRNEKRGEGETLKPSSDTAVPPQASADLHGISRR